MSQPGPQTDTQQLPPTTDIKAIWHRRTLVRIVTKAEVTPANGGTSGNGRGRDGCDAVLGRG
jgi:hypothetical protein